MPPVEAAVVFRRRFAALRRPSLEVFAMDLAKRVARQSITCLVTDDNELRELNRKFRKKNQPTDVLSFAGEGLGELAISYDRAKAQARDFGHPIDAEVRVLMLHGALHLAGYDHESDSGEMARVESRWRRRLGLPAGLIARAEGAR
jgi:probable rRNA maturation factor